MKINNPFEEISKATRALKAVLDASDESISKLPPIERMLAENIRKIFGSDAK